MQLPTVVLSNAMQQSAASSSSSVHVASALSVALSLGVPSLDRSARSGEQMVRRVGRSSLGLLLFAWCGASVLGCEPGSSADGGATIGRPQQEEDRGPLTPAPPMSGDPGENPLYQAPPPPDCADFELGADEACDDGNRNNGDGCSANCLVIEPGYSCEPGQACVQVAVCGDSLVRLQETCDDANANSGDGCSSDCRVEAGYVCNTPGQLCVSTRVCGDAFVALGEQ